VSRRSRHSAHSLRQANRPPPDEPFVWFTREMLESASWRAMPLAARRVLDRVVLEHMAHGGTRNGELQVTYDDFKRYGLSSRRATAQAIRVAVALGFLDVTTQGRRSYGGSTLPSRYGLTWLLRCDLTSASNRWRIVRSLEAAKQIVRSVARTDRNPERKTEGVERARAA
jgi:hypothetical protein